MAASGKDDDASAFSDSDQQWFDRLSGKLVAAGDEAPLREAEVLRRALAAERATVAAEVDAANTPEEQERQWQRTQFRLRREGLLQGGPSRRRFWQATAAVAATVLVTVLVLRRPVDDSPPLEEPPTLRGDETVVKRQEAEPRRAAEALAATLSAAGLRPRLYRLGKTHTVDVDLPPDASDAALAAFRQAGLDPKPGFTRIEIAPR